MCSPRIFALGYMSIKNKNPKFEIKKHVTHFDANQCDWYKIKIISLIMDPVESDVLITIRYVNYYEICYVLNITPWYWSLVVIKN